MPYAFGVVASQVRTGAYLVPAIGTVSTPDAPELTVNGNVRITARLQFVPSGPWQPMVWKNGSFNTHLWSNYLAGDYIPAGGSSQALYTSDAWPSLYPPGTDCYFGVEYRLNYQSEFWHRALISNDGKSWSVGGPNPGWVGAYAPIASFADSASPLLIGINPDGSLIFPGHISWIQLEQLDASFNPVGVVWRFDANDYKGPGATYTDPRGRVWTLTNPLAIKSKT